MTEQELPISDDSHPSQRGGGWETQLTNLPFGLVGAILWLAALLATRWGMATILQAWLGAEWLERNYHFPDAIVWTLFTVALLVWVKLIRRKPLWALGLTLKRLPGDLLFALIGAVAMGAFYLLLLGGLRLYFGMTTDAPMQALRGFLEGAVFSRSDVWFLLAVVLFYPIVEEVWFRGVLYGPMRREFGRWIAIIGGALLFAFSHDNWLPVNQLIGGIAFAVAYEFRRTLVAPFLLHIAGNGALALLAWLLPRVDFI